MSANVDSPEDSKLSVPFILLVLCMFALLVSLLGMVRTSVLATERMASLQTAWQAVQDGSVEGSELVETDRLMQRLKLPVPAMRNAVWWSLGLAILSCLLLAWMMSSQRKASRAQHTVQLHQAELEAQQESLALQRLLDEVTPLTSGDLRVRASVTETPTGALAEVHNYAISELRWLVGTMGHAVTCMEQAIERARSAQADVSRAGDEQSAQTLHSSKQLSSLGSAMADIATEAADSSATAKQSLLQSDHGVDSLGASLECLTSVRRITESTKSSMHRLVDNIAAIDTQLGMIREVARRGDLLALNTSIRAAAGAQATFPANAAAELGRLADEVSQLAGLLGQASGDIETLTMTIAQDAKETARAMAFMISELDAGMQRTQEASVSLQSIHEGVQSLQQRAVTLAETTTRQTSEVRALSENMDAINQLTQRMNQQATDAESVQLLEEMTVELRQALSAFVLPLPPEPKVTQESLGRDTDVQTLQIECERNTIHG